MLELMDMRYEGRNSVPVLSDDRVCRQTLKASHASFGGIKSLYSVLRGQHSKVLLLREYVLNHTNPYESPDL
jgi:hypothetical protein